MSREDSDAIKQLKKELGFKRKRGRPKSDKPTKSAIASVRLREDDREIILCMYGSVQAFFDDAIIKIKE